MSKDYPIQSPNIEAIQEQAVEVLLEHFSKDLPSWAASMSKFGFPERQSGRPGDEAVRSERAFSRNSCRGRRPEHPRGHLNPTNHTAGSSGASSLTEQCSSYAALRVSAISKGWRPSIS